MEMISGATAEFAIQKKSLSVQVFELLERRIVNGTLRPGSRLAEEAIAEEFGISRSPVREAISELERVGLAERLGPRARRVVTPTIEFISEIYDTWCILEIGRTYLSCIAAPASDHQRILELLDAMEETMRLGQLEQHVDLSREFHKMLTHRCGNEQLLRVIRDFERHTVWLTTIYFSEVDVSQASMKEHREIARHYIGKDVLGLIDCVQRHARRQGIKVRLVMMRQLDERERAVEKA
jgi:DNA-binding GntR family transcriptional regulator